MKRIAISMIEGLASTLSGFLPNDPGDLQWSARASKTYWLKCEGQAVSRTTYSALFSEIGSTFGVGDGSTTFNLPDGRGRALIGVGTGVLTEAVAAAGVTPASDTIAVGSNTDRWVTGMKVRVSTTGTLPTGISAATDYFLIRDTATTIKLASSLANAVAGTAIDITAAGSGTHTVTHTLTARALGVTGGEEIHANTTNEMPSHSHTAYNASTGAGGSQIQVPTSGGSMLSNNMTVATGGSGAHNNMPPFLGANLFIFSGVS